MLLLVPQFCHGNDCIELLSYIGTTVLVVLGRGEQIRLFTFLADRAELTLTSPQLWLLLKVTKVIVASAGNRTLDRQGVKPKRYL